MEIIKERFIYKNEKLPGGSCEYELRGYLHKDEFIRPAVLICPGGGYVYLTPHESDQTAMEFFGRGYDTFVCDYPIRHYAVYPAPQVAALFSIKYIRDNADEWNIKKDNIAIGGFSAGAHVAVCAGTLYNNEAVMNELVNVYRCDEASGSKACASDKSCQPGGNTDIRPDALILIYPCIGADIPGYTDDNGNEIPLRCDKLVDNDTPPAFIVTSFGDGFVSCNQSLNMARAMSDNDVPFELHCFEIGDHGALNADNLSYNEFTTRRIGNESWFQMCLDWLRDRFNENVGFGCNLKAEGRTRDEYYKLNLEYYLD